MINSKRAFLIVALSVFSSMLGVGIIAPLLPLYAKKMGASGLGIGFLFAGFSLARTFTMPLSGALSDKRGRKLFLSLGLLSYSLLSLGYIYAQGIVSLIVVRLLHGTASGMVIPIAQAYVGELSPAGEEGRWQGYFNTALFSGLGGGPLLGGLLTDCFGMEKAFMAMGLMNFVGFLGVVFLLPEIRKRGKRVSSFPSPLALKGRTVMKAVLAFQFAYSVGRGTIIGFLPLLASMRFGLSPTRIGILVSTITLLNSSFQPLGGFLADRLSRTMLVSIGGLASSVLLALLPLAGSFTGLFLICLLLALGGGISLPSASALVVQEGRIIGMGVAMSLLGMAFSLGMTVGPLTAGLIADTLSIEETFLFACLLSLMGTASFSLLVRRSK